MVQTMDTGSRVETIETSLCQQSPSDGRVAHSKSPLHSMPGPRPCTSYTSHPQVAYSSFYLILVCCIHCALELGSNVRLAVSAFPSTSRVGFGVVATDDLASLGGEPGDLAVLDKELGEVPVNVLDGRLRVRLQVLPDRLRVGAVDVALGVSGVRRWRSVQEGQRGCWFDER